MDTRIEASEASAPEGSLASANVPAIRFALVGIFIIAFVYALYFARDFFMPVVLAFLLALTLSPIMRFFLKRGVPAVASATLLVLFSATAIGITGYLVSGPVADLITNAPSIGREVTERLSELRKPFDHLLRISSQVDHMAEATEEPGVQKVVVAQPGIISRAAGTLMSVATSIAVTFVLSLFLLASGTMFYEKIVQSFTRLTDKKRALRVVYDVEREISRYLFTIALINFGLGVAVGLGLWAIGLPNPFVWGIAAGLLNFLPYVGAILTIFGVAAISLVSFDTFSYALLAPAFVLLCNIIEGHAVTPFVVGRRLELNAVAIFIAVAFWSWLWGIVGALIAVPLLVAIKVFCDHFEGLNRVGNFLSAQQAATEEPETPDPAPASQAN
jgi:predicted PurR-regulated permease PerM